MTRLLTPTIVDYVVTGHSKGSSRAGKAAFINEDNWEADRGPHAKMSDRFQVALLSAGRFNQTVNPIKRSEGTDEELQPNILSAS